MQLQLNVMDKKLTQKTEEMNILLNYKVSQNGGNGYKSRDMNYYFFAQSIKIR